MPYSVKFMCEQDLKSLRAFSTMKFLLIFILNLNLCLICLSDPYDWVNNVIMQLIIFH